MSILRKAAHRSRDFAQTEALERVPIDHAACVFHCLRILSSVYGRAEGAARRVCSQTLRYAGYADRDVARVVSGIRVKLQSHSDAQSLRALASIEASGLPETEDCEKRRRREECRPCTGCAAVG